MLAFVLAGVPFLFGCPPGDEPIQVVVEDQTNSNASSPEEIRELARREGEMSWYTSLPQDGAEEFLALFEKEHPYITTHLVRGSTFDTVQKVQSEIEAGDVQADVLHVLDVAVFTQLRRKGALMQYSSPEERAIPTRYKDPGYWSALRVVGLCIAYDSRRLDREDAPDTWPGLLEDRWKGRVGLKDAQTAGSAYAHYYFLREEYGVSYWERMARQRPRIYKTSDETLDALEAGEVDLVSGAMGYSVYDRMRAGSTIRPLWPKDGVPMMLGPVAILRSAPHRNAARLFIDFALSQKGQKALQDILGGESVRMDVEAPPERAQLSELKVMSPAGGWTEYADRQETLRSEYMGVFHPGSE
ncbi:MAG: extracellular solute-binding protein [Armatimonadetes bacterium]|nr:extracellular solute-binding protein [Armatimonadota bacterium]MDI9583793.1 extracellular solute-binding protein [Acidobacteriota bacterium]